MGGGGSISLSDGASDDYFVGATGAGTVNGADVGEAGFVMGLFDFTGTMLGSTLITEVPAFVPPVHLATFEILDDADQPAFGGNLSALTAVESCDTVIVVEIDLKPGSNPSTVNLGSQGVTPLAIFGSAEFDATQIDINSLEINGEEANAAVVGNGNVLVSLEDLNGDGFVDAVVKFETEGLALADNAPLVLTGTLIDGTAFSGEQPEDDPVNIVP